jgi:myo-inositol 2-dehydrogenase/D-chiro-inositol 1-dehydrogenase
MRALQRIAGATLVAAADPDSGARARAQRVTRVPVYASSAELFDRDEVDAVVICTPSGTHAELAVTAARSGKHIYIEKPLATSAMDAQKVIEAVSNAGVTAVVGFNRRMHPLFARARELLDGGRIGRIRGVQMACCEPAAPMGFPTWKAHRNSGGGVLLDLASHHIDLLRWYLRGDVTVATASITSENTEHDSATLDLVFANGVRAQGYFSFAAGMADHLEFLGEAGTLRVDRYRPSVELRGRRQFRYGMRRRWVDPALRTAAWRLYRKMRPGRDPSYKRALQAFVDAVNGESNQLASLTDGLRALEVVLAAEQSALSGAPVRLR